MENGVEALKIAASMLIFVLAITITISCFTSATQALNRIFNMQSDDEYVKAIDENGNEYYLNFVRFDGGTREVSAETIIPAIYRAYKENYAIYFYNFDKTPMVFYERENGEKVNYIDALKESDAGEGYSNDSDVIERISKLLYEDGLYQEIEGSTFIEMLGEYYMNDIGGETETAEVNKIKKRVIAYIKK